MELSDDTVSDSVIIGEEAAFLNSAGEANVCIGGRTGYGAANGANYNRSVLIGIEAGGQLNSNGDNVFIGERAGRSATQDRNIAFGNNAGEFCNNQNVVIGYQAMRYANGGGSVCIGSTAASTQVAGGNLTVMQNGVYIGKLVKGTQSSQYEVVIGALSEGRGNNTFQFGRRNIQHRMYMEGRIFLENGYYTGDEYRLTQMNTPPASSTAPGDEGQILIDANSIYICTSANTWKKVDLTTF